MARTRKAKQNEAMPTWTFTLVLSGVHTLTDEVEDALFEASCDDALVGTRDGIFFLDFAREALSFRAAVLSAIADVEEAGIGARVVRVEPDDQVTMTEQGRPDTGVLAAAINAALEVRRHVPDPREAMQLVEAIVAPDHGMQGTRKARRRSGG